MYQHSANPMPVALLYSIWFLYIYIYIYMHVDKRINYSNINIY